MIHKGTQEIETKRLVLRRFLVDDAEAMFNNWASDEEVTKYLTWPTHKDIDNTKKTIAYWVEQYKKDNFYNWCIALKETGEIIGSIGSTVVQEEMECIPLGYCMSKRYWNNGIMTEALDAVIKFFFGEVKANRIEACHHLENIASGKVMQKCGLGYEGIKRHGAKDNSGNYCDVAVYSILAKDRFINADMK